MFSDAAGGDVMKKKLIQAVAMIAIIVLLLTLDCVVHVARNRKASFRNSKILCEQIESVITSHKRKEKGLINSLKNEYIARAQAVSYIIDKYPIVENDTAELLTIANHISVDEINLFDIEGKIYSGTQPEYFGVTLDAGEQIQFFKPILTDKTLSLCQDVTPNTASGKLMMYAMCWNDAGSRIVQVGIELTRLLKELRADSIADILKEIIVIDGIEILIAEKDGGKIVGATNGIENVALLSDLRLSADGFADSESQYMRINRFGKSWYCVLDSFDSYIVMALQDRRNANKGLSLTLFITLLYLVFAAVVISFTAYIFAMKTKTAEEAAFTDPMTNLKSRLAYEEAIKAYKDSPLPSALFYIVMDLNGLKHTNDTLGHATGDELIKGAARCIRKALGQNTDIYRVGGDEFAAIVTSEENEIREDIAALKVRTEEWSSTHSLLLSISCGYAEASEADTIGTLCERADQKMYEEKARFYKESAFDRRRRRN